MIIIIIIYYYYYLLVYLSFLKYLFSDTTGTTATLLISHGANLNDNRNPKRSTPLHLALRQFNEVTAIVLVQAGCDVNVQVSLY